MTDDELLDFDFEGEVKITKEKIAKTEEAFGESTGKASAIQDRLTKISSSFELLEETATEMTVEVDKEVKEIKALSNITATDMFQLDILYQDFSNIRGTLISTVNQGKIVIDTLTNEIVCNPTDSEMVASYSQLISVVNSSMKLLGTTYKDISDVILQIRKIEEISNVAPSSVTNIQNNFYAESTADIIKQLRDSKVGKS